MRFVTSVLVAMLAVVGWGIVVLGSSSANALWFSRVVGTGAVVRSERVLGAFRAISVHGSTDVHVTIGNPQSVVLEAQPNIADLIETKVEDGTLVVTSQHSYTSTKSPILFVTIPQLDSVRTSGSSDITLVGMRGPNLDIAIHGSGDVRASGNVERLTYSCSGSGDAFLQGLAVRDAVVRVRGSGDAKLNVAATLDVEVSGSGDIRYTGSPRIIHQSVRGSGSVAAD